MASAQEAHWHTAMSAMKPATSHHNWCGYAASRARRIILSVVTPLEADPLAMALWAADPVGEADADAGDAERRTLGFAEELIAEAKLEPVVRRAGD